LQLFWGDDLLFDEKVSQSLRHLLRSRTNAVALLEIAT
jgi:hypothetical protein